MTDLKVGDVGVFFYGPADFQHPLNHNSREFPGHPCRTTVLKIGRKWVHCSSLGAPIKASVDGSHNRVLPLEEAKAKYEADLTANRAYRTDEFIAKCVEGL